MNDDDIRSNKKILRDEHEKAKEALATAYSTARRVGEVLEFYGGVIREVPKSEELPRFKELRSSAGHSIDGLPVDYLQGLVDDIARLRADVSGRERELARLHVEFVPFGKWP